MIIRTATESDLPQVLQIEQESFTPPWSYEAFLYELLLESSLFNVAVIDSSIVGFYVLRSLIYEAEIINLAVSKPYRRQSVAHELMKSILNYASNYALEKIFLEVRKSNEPAITLYKKFGFSAIGIRKDYYIEPTEDAITMVLEMRNKVNADIGNRNIV